MILVTGGTGLLGSHLLYHLSKTEDDIKALYRDKDKLELVKTVFSYYSDNYNSLFNKIEWVKGDILDIPFLEDVFNNISIVYHVAAIVDFDRRNEKQMNRVNIEGTANIVNLCLANNIDKLCHVSSIATLSKPLDKSEATEEDYWNPDAVNSGYGISKNGAEMEVWRGVEEGLSVIIVNSSIIIGPGFWNTSSGKLFTTVKNGMRFFTSGSSGFVGVNDVANAMIMLMKSDVKNERFIINSENITYKEVFTLIANNLNVTPPTMHAKGWMLSIAWRLDVLKSMLLGTKQKLNKDSARSAVSKNSYSNSRITATLQMSFTPIEDVIKLSASLFKT